MGETTMAKTKSGRAVGVTKITDEARIASAASGPERRIIPLAQGTYAYVIDPVTSKNIHCKVASDAFSTLIADQAALSPAYADRLRRELSSITHGDFPDAYANIEKAGAAAGQADTADA